MLDESLPRRLSNELGEHTVSKVVEVGWSGEKNGKLLALAAGQFDVFVTADRNLQYQQNLAVLPLAVVVLVAYDNRWIGCAERGVRALYLFHFGDLYSEL